MVYISKIYIKEYEYIYTYTLIQMCMYSLMIDSSVHLSTVVLSAPKTQFMYLLHMCMDMFVYMHLYIYV